MIASMSFLILFLVVWLYLPRCASTLHLSMEVCYFCLSTQIPIPVPAPLLPLLSPTKTDVAFVAVLLQLI